MAGCAKNIILHVSARSFKIWFSSRPKRPCFMQHRPEANILVESETSQTNARLRPIHVSLGELFNDIFRTLPPKALIQSRQV